MRKNKIELLVSNWEIKHFFPSFSTNFAYVQESKKLNKIYISHIPGNTRERVQYT